VFARVSLITYLTDFGEVIQIGKINRYHPRSPHERNSRRAYNSEDEIQEASSSKVFFTIITSSLRTDLPFF